MRASILPPAPPTTLARRYGRALGSPLGLTIAADDAAADAAWSAVVRVFAEVDRSMSRFRDDSELTQLSRRGGEPAVCVSRMLVRALCAADRARRMTDGRFEPRIVDALERIGYAGVPQGPARPGRESAGVAQGPARRGGESAGVARAGGRVLERHGRTGPVTLPEPVDLGGIGKGLALRWAASAIGHLLTTGDGQEPPGFLLDAGGDIVISGAPAPGEPWHLGIEDPGGGTAPLATLKASGRLGVATSSTSRLHWRRGNREVHHLIDPRTRKPGGAGLVAVTVAGPDPAWAEVWSKTLFLEGARAIAAEARARGLAAWWVTDDGRLEMTAAARSQTVWVAAEA